MIGIFDIGEGDLKLVVIQNSRIIRISVCLNNPFLDWYILLILDSILLLFLRFAMFLSVNTAFYKPCRQD